MTSSAITRQKQHLVPAWLLIVAGVMTVCPVVHGASVQKKVGEANDLYKQGLYEDALVQYQEAIEKNKHPDRINYNIGSAYYKKKQYQQAIDHFRQALLSESDGIRQKALYNLGNAQYRKGMLKAEDDKPAAIAELEEALKSYERAMALAQEEDKDAAYNHEFVKKKIEELKKQQQQQQQDNQQGEQQQDTPQSDSDQQEQGQQQDQQQSSSGQQDNQQGQQQESQQKDQPQQQQQEEQSSENEDPQESSPQPQPSGAEPQQADPNELSKREALMLLEEYENIEEPQGLLNFIPRNTQLQPVVNDW